MVRTEMPRYSVWRRRFCSGIDFEMLYDPGYRSHLPLLIKVNRYFQTGIASAVVGVPLTLVMLISAWVPTFRLSPWVSLLGIIAASYGLGALVITFFGGSTYKTLLTARGLLSDEGVSREERERVFLRYMQKRPCHEYYCSAVGIKQAAIECGFVDTLTPQIKKRKIGWIFFLKSE